MSSSLPETLLGKTPFHFHRDDEEAKRMKLTAYTDLEIFQDSPSPVEILRDLCLKLNYPLPSFELVQQTSNLLEHEFTYLCTVSEVRRMGTAETKKIAKQMAAQEVMTVIESFSKVSTTFHRCVDFKLTFTKQ